MKESDNPDSWPDPSEGEGYYWIKVKYYPLSADPMELWTVGYWRSEEFWQTIGELENLDWDHLLEIGPRIVAPNDIDYLR